jgi:hypothetical protein
VKHYFYHHRLPILDLRSGTVQEYTIKQSRVPPRQAQAVAYEAVRNVVENWSLWRATVGPEVGARVRAEYAAHDSWENEGGAHLAHTD